MDWSRAYRAYGRMLGKTVGEMTDAEKKAAVYLEARRVAMEREALGHRYREVTDCGACGWWADYAPAMCPDCGAAWCEGYAIMFDAGLTRERAYFEQRSRGPVVWWWPPSWLNWVVREVRVDEDTGHEWGRRCAWWPVDRSERFPRRHPLRDEP